MDYRIKEEWTGRNIRSEIIQIDLFNMFLLLSKTRMYRTFYFSKKIILEITLALILIIQLSSSSFSCAVDDTYKGFILGSTDYIDLEQSSIYYTIEDFNWKSGNLHTTVDINIICRNKTKSSDIYYIFQTPFIVDTYSVTFGAWNPSFFGGETRLHTYEESDLSYLIIKVPKENASLNRLNYIRIELNYKNVNKYINNPTTSIVFNYDNDFNELLSEINYLNEYINWLDRCFPFKLKSCTLNLERFSTYTILSIEPYYDNIIVYNGKTYYRWDIKQITSSSFSSESIIMNLENQGNKNLYETSKEVFFIFIATIVALGFERYIKNREKPNLSIRLITENEPKTHHNFDVAFYHLDVLNTGQDMAISCDIRLTYRTEQGEELFSIYGKWDRSPEPLSELDDEGRVRYWPSLSAIGNLVNIRKDIPESYCIGIKGNETAFFAFNSDSYGFPFFRNPNWRLDTGHYLLDVEIRGANVRARNRFQIINNSENRLQLQINEI